MKLNNLDDDARIWVFGTPSALDGEVERELDAFIAQWKAHGKPLAAGYGLLHDKFLVVGIDPNVDPSGCSIDKLFGLLERVDANLLDSDRVYFRTVEGEIASVSRSEFREMKERGEVSGDTKVFDLTVERLREIETRFETRAAESWHARAFLLKDEG